MRPLTIALAGFLASAAIAAEERLPELPKLDTREWGYQEVVTVEGVEAGELQSRARAWIAGAYQSAKAVTQLDDPAAGTIVAKGNFTFTYGLMVPVVDHVITLEFKAGRYRYHLSDFTLYSHSLDAWAHDAAPSEKGRAKIRGRVAALRGVDRIPP